MIQGKLWKHYRVKIRNRWSWYYEKTLESSFEIISVKLRKNYEKILENIGNTSHKIKKKYFNETLWNFQGTFWKTYKKLNRNFKQF